MEIGLLHPGEMGAAVGKLLCDAGHRVWWVTGGRSDETRARAEDAGIRSLGSLRDLVSRCATVISICPPHAAVDVASQVAGEHFGGWFLDANAISPASAIRVRSIVEGGGASYVDGGIIGSPPPHDKTTLYLSGVPAEKFATELGDFGLRTIVLQGDPPVAASALKMAYGAWTKGASALLLAVRALAAGQGVEGALVEEWDRSQPGLFVKSLHAARSALAKGWRWSGEMDEVAASFEELGLPPGFGNAAAEIYGRFPRAKPTGDEADLERVLRELAGGPLPDIAEH